MDPRVTPVTDGLEGPVKIDLHVHSSFSDRPYSWFLRSSHAAECYTSPATVYATAKARGMNLVTLCDHDTIDGALELRALADDTFISEEVSARFTEDGCIVHTIVVDISETQHQEIQRLRANIYELVTYLHHALPSPVAGEPPAADAPPRALPAHVSQPRDSKWDARRRS